jgi:subtilase family serine protease
MKAFRHLSVLSGLVLCLGVIPQAVGQHEALLPAKINDAKMVVIAGNTRPELSEAQDLGAVDDSLPLESLEFVLQRSPATQAAFTEYLEEESDPASANFHKWLTNAQIGTKFGPAQADIDTVKAWLEAKGFTVNSVSPDETVMEFAGTAGLVRAVFKAPMHNLMVDGQAHIANVKDPELPADLTPVVVGIASLNDFMPHTLSHPRVANSLGKMNGNGNAGGGYNYLGAADLATIYNFKPAFAVGVTGRGQTIAVIEDTDLYSTEDWTAFRRTLGLSAKYPEATLTEVNPAGSNKCKDPGVNGDDVEAAIDVEWASAAAPNAAIVNASCKNTKVQFGGFLALSNLLEQGESPSIVSISYGEAETELGATENLYIRNLYASAAAQGVSLFVSSGDEGAASADANKTTAKHGIGVSGFTSTPYNVSVGGTDFGYIPLGTPGTYFNTTDGKNFQTATGYIPEIPWNDSCAGALAAAYKGFPTTGKDSFCNTTEFGTPNPYLTTAAGSGGPSGCATGVPAVESVVSGTCAGYAKPYWQKLLGVPADGVRDIPDVSLMASNGVWGVYYAVCLSDPAYQSPCGGNPALWTGFGGTSISSPIWAGIQALVNQSTRRTWGNSNPVLYTLANLEYGKEGRPGCNSSLGNQVSPLCVFYDVTQGDMAVNCSALKIDGSKTDIDCYNDGGKYGVLSVSDEFLVPAYSAGRGWDFGSGIGSGNATNVVAAWTLYSLAIR